VSLYPCALVARHGTPRTSGYFILHEGLIGVLGDQGEQQVTYKTIEDKKNLRFDVTNAWMGITDKYWAAVLLPDTNAHLQAEFSANTTGPMTTYQTLYVLNQQVIAPGGSGAANARLFAGAKEVAVVGINFALADVGGYNKQLNLNKFDLLIDWGWFYFITKPLFLVMDIVYIWTGNFGVAILLVTALIKFIYFPFANQSYRSLIKMRQLQPQIAALRDRFPEQEQANREIADLHKRENVTAPTGCLPIIAQVLVTFSLYKILFVTIESRASSFGWIQDLAAPDQTNAFNLFGLIPFDPTEVPLVGNFLHLGALPILLGLTIWQLQQKISPILLSPFRRKIYSVLPILVIYFVNDMIAGMLIYFTWFNCLSILHQLLLMNKEKGYVGDISENSAEVLPYGKIQPIVLLTMLAPVLQNLLTVLVFWRRSKTGGRDRA
jgi:YidC/Oxa1 family membrane protein insertase